MIFYTRRQGAEQKKGDFTMLDRYRQSIREMAKKMTVEEKQDYLLTVYKNRKVSDCGKEGKAFEPSVGLYLSGKKALALYVKEQSVADKIWSVGKISYVIESKTGSGKGLVKASVVNYLKEQGLEPCDMIDYVYPSADFIVYAPEYNPYEPVEYQGFVFTRDEFIEMLKGYERSSMVSIHPQTGELRIMANSKVKINYLWDACLNQPSLETFKTAMLAEANK